MFDAYIPPPPIPYYQYVIPIANKTQCKKKPPPKVTISIKNKKIKYDSSKSSKQLEAFKIDTVSPYGADVHTKISGLTAGKIGVELQALIAYSTHPITKSGCMWYEKIIIKITTDPTVYIASEHKNNKCRYNKTLKHELKHVSVDRRTVKQYTERMRSTVSKRAKEIGVKNFKKRYSVKKEQKKMLKDLNLALQPIIKNMNTVRSKRQQVIDSKKEYDRLSRSCGGKF